MLKRFTVNTILSFIWLILMGLLFTFVGFFVIDLMKSFSVIGLLILFCSIVCLGYYIGRNLHYIKGVGVVSVVILPMILFAALYALCLAVISVVAMILQYPAAVWLEALNIKADNTGAMFYVIAFVHYLVYSLALFAGTYKKRG